MHALIQRILHAFHLLIVGAGTFMEKMIFIQKGQTGKITQMPVLASQRMEFFNMESMYRLFIWPQKIVWLRDICIPCFGDSRYISVNFLLLIFCFLCWSKWFYMQKLISINGAWSLFWTWITGFQFVTSQHWLHS